MYVIKNPEGRYYSLFGWTPDPQQALQFASATAAGDERGAVPGLTNCEVVPLPPRVRPGVGTLDKPIFPTGGRRG